MKKQDGVEDLDNDAAIAKAAARAKMIDPALYPRIRGETGLFKVTTAQVENYVVLTRALAGDQEGAPFQPKHPDFADYLINSALR